MVGQRVSRPVAENLLEGKPRAETREGKEPVCVGGNVRENELVTVGFRALLRV